MEWLFLMLEWVLAANALSVAYVMGGWKRREEWAVELVEALVYMQNWPFE